ncbi:MAG: MerR family transcriptional regulator [Deltaproteobacteria bacterium]|nr:MerR family transcriptional regulator [Deltaproteobacteria bacterium]
MSRNKKLEEVSRESGVEPQTILEFIHQEWIVPVEPGIAEGFDDEDVARTRLIHELRDDFGVNDEGIEIILHLLDEIYALHFHKEP